MNTTNKVKVGIIGPGNIGSDLMYKMLKNDVLEMEMMTGVVESEGIKRAQALGIRTSLDSVNAVAEDPSIKIVFDATSADAHAAHAPILEKAGKITVDMTPAAIGPYVVPCVNLDDHAEALNFNMITCGGQSVIPIVYAINKAADVEYAEIISAISSKSAGPGTRANINKFVETTSKALVSVGGADRGKAIIILNPSEPPVMMTTTVYTIVKNVDEKKILDEVDSIVKKVQHYVPGYTLRVPPVIDGNLVTVIIEVEGAGDFLPKYAGNLDIINQAAIAVAEKIAGNIIQKERADE